MKFLLYDTSSTGNLRKLKGFFDDAENPVIPESAVPITDETWDDCSKNYRARRYDVTNSKVVTIDLTLSLDDLKQQAQQSIADFATSIRGQITNNADAAKIAGWPRKERIAELVLSGSADARQLVSVELEAEKRNKGETVEELAAKQLAKADMYSEASVLIDGIEEADLTTVAAFDGTAEELQTLLDTLRAEAEAELAAFYAKYQ